jgi:transcriptional regulator GlxA family with amidase domain
MKIFVAVTDDVFDTGLAALQDTFETANELAGEARFVVSVIAPGGTVRTHHGLVLHAKPPTARAPDLVIVPALACKQPATLLAALEREDVQALSAVVARYAARSRVAAACTGTFVLGHAGVLDGRRATTTWWLGPTFRKRFPAVELEETEMLVRDGDVLTAGAALAHFDLALAVVRERSPELASLVARYLLVDDRPSQAAFVVPAHLAHDDELVKSFERWVRRHVGEPFDLSRVARAVGTSERTLQRRVRSVLGKPPIAFVQDLRLERAMHLLRSTRRTIEDVASAVGYEDGSTLRTLLRRRRGTGLRDLRREPGTRQRATT